MKPGSDETLDISLTAKELDAKLGDVLGILGTLEPKLPKDISISALSGDPGAELPGAEPEPGYDAKKRGNIQGNTIPGFNKDHQHFLFFRLGPKRGAKQWQPREARPGHLVRVDLADEIRDEHRELSTAIAAQSAAPRSGARRG
jgi:hypothetical protein